MEQRVMTAGSLLLHTTSQPHSKSYLTLTLEPSTTSLPVSFFYFCLYIYNTIIIIIIYFPDVNIHTYYASSREIYINIIYTS